MPATEALAKFILETEFEKIPSVGLKRAKESIIDCIGCMLLGSAEPVGEIISEHVKAMRAKPVSTVVGRGFKTVPSLAALANGTMGHAVDYDDTAPAIFSHPSVALVPAILALGELTKASGRDILEAYIVGFEVEFKLGLALGHGHYVKGWHVTSTLGTVAAAAASIKLLKFTELDKIRMALAIAASQAAGLRQNFGTMTKPFHSGNAARSGVEAALLAQRGFTAALDIIEAPVGYCRVFAGEEPCDLDVITAGSDEFEIVKSGIAIKPYPSCLGTHSMIEGIIGLARKYRFAAKDVESIECSLEAAANSALLYRQPETGLQGKFSAEYCIARALLDGTVKLSDFTEERVKQPQVREVMKKITRRIDPSIEKFGTVLDIKLKDGRRVNQCVVETKGWPSNPLTSGELAEKYRDCARAVLPEESIGRSLELMGNLEQVKRISELMRVVIGKSPEPANVKA